MKRYGITEGVLVTDDTDHQRSKKTPQLFKTHKIKDKGTGGYINGQNIILLMLVTGKISLPVGFEIYQPDPVKQAWAKEDKRLQKQKVKKKDRPPEPPNNPEYPSKSELVLRLMRQFHRQHHLNVKVKAIVADALYGQAALMDAASFLFDKTQVISQLRSNQNIQVGSRIQALSEYFEHHPGLEQEIRIRGQQTIKATVRSLRVKVCAHEKKRFVIALKYPGEKEYRYLVATDMSWRTLNIIQAYSLRWIVEVFFEDWKSYEGWAQLAKQTGVEGTSHGLSLSLLLDLPPLASSRTTSPY